ncbi:MAG: hypothetical protein JNL01_10290 [Bdellovibrionales bacterium]|nr:hypothetical protein [Bdellovibrionales bacterium]
MIYSTQKAKASYRSIFFGLVVLMAAVAVPMSALADLVLEENLNAAPRAQVIQQAPLAAPVQVDADRDSLRAVLGTSVRAETAVQAPQEAGPSLTKSELLRRARMREELKNEDILQERLEELRLREERRLTDQLLGVKGQELVQGQQPQAVRQAPAQTEYLGTTATDQIKTSQASAVDAKSTVATDEFRVKNGISLTPKIGIANMVNTQLFNVTPRYSAGAELGVPVSDNVAVTIGYQFNQYGVGLTPGNWAVLNAQAYTPAAYTQGYAPYVLNQNVIDGAVKINILSTASRFRPYVGGGIAYARSFLNYDPSVIQTLNQAYGQYMNLTNDYTTNSFLGSVQLGADVAISNNVLIGVNAKYYNVFAAQENQQMNSGAFFNQSFYGYNPDPTKVFAGGSLARQNFYSITATASFAF